MHCQDPVQAVIWQCLQHYDFKTAIFLAERLCAEQETDEIIYLLATSYYRAKQTPQAYWLLKKKSCPSPQCRYLQACCAYELKDYTGAEHILTSYDGAGELKSFDLIAKEFGSIACFALQLLAKIYRRSERLTMAAKANQQALKLNPFLWQAYVELCNVGEEFDIGNIFTISDLHLLELGQHSYLQPFDNDKAMEGDTKISFFTPKNNVNVATNVVCNNCSTPMTEESPKFCKVAEESGFALLTEQFNSLTSISPVTPSCISEKVACEKQIISSVGGGVAVGMGVGIGIGDAGNAPFKNQTAKATDALLEATGNVATKLHVFTPAGNTPARCAFERQNLKTQLTGLEIESSKENKQSTVISKWSPRKLKYRFTKEIRLDESDEEKEHATANSKQQISFIGEPSTIHSEATATKQQLQYSKQNMLAFQKQAADKMLSLLHDLAVGFQLLANFQCKKAIEHFDLNTAKHQLNSCGLQSIIAKCHYELQHYDEAAKIFKHIHETEPCRFEYMDIYSSCLWQLQQPIELSALAQDLVNCNRLSPITWCVAGNCFSLQNDHTTAIKLMQRAMQVDSDFVYGYTLLGFEHFYHDDLDEARSCFAAAVARDCRHYNAWFGIGTTYAKQQKHQQAELYFRKALRINHTNSVIHVHIAVMQHAQQHYQQALLTLNMAMKLNPDNLIAKLQRARIYFALKRYHQALQQLEELKNMAPKESIVFQLLGNVHQAMGHNELALMYFSWSTDVDSKKAEPFTPVLPKRWL